MAIVVRVPILVLSAIFLGCGSGSGAAAVSGVVTLDGKPLPNALVAFQPVAESGGTPGPGSYGTTDASGAYTLRRADNDQPGAVIGNHRVVIDLKTESSDDRDPRSRPPAKTLPPRYNRQSELTFKVEPGGSKAANFDLKSQ